MDDGDGGRQKCANGQRRQKKGGEKEHQRRKDWKKCGEVKGFNF